MPTHVAGDGIVVEAAASAADLAARSDLLWSVRGSLGDNAVVWPAGAEMADVVHWRVGVVEASAPGHIDWSEPAVFERAPADHEWDASWITSREWADPAPEFNGPPPVLGTDFGLRGSIVSARLHLAVAGVADIRLNDEPVSDEVLGLGYTVESRSLPARTFDVTHLVGEGVNRLRITIAGGISWVPPIQDRYTKLTTHALPPRVLGRLEVLHDDGERAVVVTDGRWRASEGPVRMSHWFGGEDIDARVTDSAGPVSDDAWRDCAVLGPSRSHRVWWPCRPPLRIAERLPGIVHSVSGESSIIDFGTNVAGWPVLDLRECAEGEVVVVRPAEILLDGELDQRTTGSPIRDSYVTRGGDQEWHPRHVYHGFRFIEVTGVPPERFTAEAAVIRADNEAVGAFATDDAFLQTLHTLIDRAVQGNMYSVFTDCPNREKLGWIEQLYLCFGPLTRLYDVEAHLRDTLGLMRDAQVGSGLIPSIVPQTVDFSGVPWEGDPTGFVDDVNWGGAIGFLPLLHYREYGDRRVLEENADALRRYLDHLEMRSDDDLLDFGLGDWIALDDSTPRAMVATYGWIRLLRAAAATRHVLGDEGGARALEERAASIVARFVRAFRDGLRWGSANQASYAFALDLGVVPAHETGAVFGHLLAAIEAADGRLTVGENSWPALVRVLHANRRDDLIDRMVRNDDGPGYGLQIALGATSLAETWRGASGAMYENSQNHFMLGMIDDWIAEDVAGLAQSDDSVAWRHARLHPSTGFSIAQTTTRGRFGIEHGDGRLTVDVPAGAEARVTVDGESHALGGGRWEWRA
ncbi:MAG: family 78 glycoside hydrolase catalytic domain [Microbacterium sp.]